MTPEEALAKVRTWVEEEVADYYDPVIDPELHTALRIVVGLPPPIHARTHLAWLLWCYQQGYANPQDRAIMTNWIADDPEQKPLCLEDEVERENLLAMADEILRMLP